MSKLPLTPPGQLDLLRSSHFLLHNPESSVIIYPPSSVPLRNYNQQARILPELFSLPYPCSVGPVLLGGHQLARVMLLIKATIARIIVRHDRLIPKICAPRWSFGCRREERRGVTKGIPSENLDEAFDKFRTMPEMSSFGPEPLVEQAWYSCRPTFDESEYWAVSSRVLYHEVHEEILSVHIGIHDVVRFFRKVRIHPKVLSMVYHSSR